MYKWIRKLIGLCNHQWHDREEIKIYNSDYSQVRPVGFCMSQRCELCGQFRRLKM